MKIRFLLVLSIICVSGNAHAMLSRATRITASKFTRLAVPAAVSTSAKREISWFKKDEPAVLPVNADNLVDDAHLALKKLLLTDYKLNTELVKRLHKKDPELIEKLVSAIEGQKLTVVEGWVICLGLIGAGVAVGTIFAE